MKITIIAAVTFLLSGCLSMGVHNMSAEQIRATEGMVTCTTVYTAYGKGNTTTVNADDTRKGNNSKGKITISPECAVTIESDTAAAPTK